MNWQAGVPERSLACSTNHTARPHSVARKWHRLEEMALETVAVRSKTTPFKGPRGSGVNWALCGTSSAG